MAALEQVLAIVATNREEENPRVFRMSFANRRRSPEPALSLSETIGGS